MTFPSREPVFPVRAMRSSPACTHTGAPVTVRACSANPVWSGCACVSRIASRSAALVPSAAAAWTNLFQSRGVPASTSTSFPDSWIR
jgi:hypothetical protein